MSKEFGPSQPGARNNSDVCGALRRASQCEVPEECTICAPKGLAKGVSFSGVRLVGKREEGAPVNSVPYAAKMRIILAFIRRSLPS